MQKCKCANVQMCKCANVQMCMQDISQNKLVFVNAVVKNHSNIVNSIGVNLSESYVHRKREVWPNFPKFDQLS